MRKKVAWGMCVCMQCVVCVWECVGVWLCVEVCEIGVRFWGVVDV